VMSAWGRSTRRCSTPDGVSDGRDLGGRDHARRRVRGEALPRAGAWHGGAGKAEPGASSSSSSSSAAAGEIELCGDEEQGYVGASYACRSALSLLYRGIEQASAPAKEWGGRREGGASACRDPVSRGSAAVLHGLWRDWREGWPPAQASARGCGAAAARCAGRRRRRGERDCNCLFLSSVGDTKKKCISSYGTQKANGHLPLYVLLRKLLTTYCIKPSTVTQLELWFIL
jgi:hypothetical protein